VTSTQNPKTNLSSNPTSSWTIRRILNIIKNTMHPTTRSLQSVYNTHATHFSQTRKKHRPEIDYIINYINNIPQKTLNVIELWCGDGRLYGYLTTQTEKTIKYTGIDIAEKLLAIGKKNYPQANFIHADMTEAVTKWKQESVDIVISIAAFHHLPNEKSRLFVLKNIYRLLKYDGALIMTNRALSTWFIKKYSKQLIQSISKRVTSLGSNSRRDVFITRNKQWARYYHIFSKKRLTELHHQAGFTVQHNHYMDNTWQKTNCSKSARNILTIAYKSIKKQ
jgi:ubiquinone/menaquinone biosynthesis C-methylase UbiE